MCGCLAPGRHWSRRTEQVSECACVCQCGDELSLYTRQTAKPALPTARQTEPGVRLWPLGPGPVCGRGPEASHRAAGLWRPLVLRGSHPWAGPPAAPPGARLCGSAMSDSPSPSCALVPLRPHQDKTDTIRCIKSCRPNDVTCMLDPVHTISHTVVSLSTFREFTRPEGEWRPPQPGIGSGVPGEAWPLSREAACGAATPGKDVGPGLEGSPSAPRPPVLLSPDCVAPCGPLLAPRSGSLMGNSHSAKSH